MSKIILEREKCIGCGSCQTLCPKYFEISEDGKALIKNSTRDPKTGNDELEINKTECGQEAADSCPVQCIHIK
ncbi:ferredoxin [Patescibacteria group bacterium]|nr:ferredoxin [Patescibacteria group bacterium]MBU4274806.1 ferredoxin [Patescibacteria group bacterium]MBU4367778.1 ferredoxin [Patescibacteria group bacterium]MBU4461468.1 ferredoxin [Patescibacteria group bacterium]MCG2700400.1 ferredoxin [Candidatus Parcubacteria bacterium]